MVFPQVLLQGYHKGSLAVHTYPTAALTTYYRSLFGRTQGHFVAIPRLLTCWWWWWCWCCVLVLVVVVVVLVLLMLVLVLLSHEVMAIL